LSDVREIRLHHFFIRLNINNNERLFDLCYPKVTLCISIQTYLRLNSLNDHQSQIREEMRTIVSFYINLFLLYYNNVRTKYIFLLLDILL